MTADITHLLASHRSIEVRREQRLWLERKSSCHLNRGNHAPSFELLLPQFLPGCAIRVVAHFPLTYAVKRRRNASRPRVNRDFTVPSETSVISAISSYDMSSRSRKITVCGKAPRSAAIPLQPGRELLRAPRCRTAIHLHRPAYRACRMFPARCRRAPVRSTFPAPYAGTTSGAGWKPHAPRCGKSRFSGWTRP